MAQIEEIPGALSQGRTREAARANVLDALRLILTADGAIATDPDRRPLAIQVVTRAD